MHIHTLEQWQHSHDFLADQDVAEKKTRIVMLLTTVTMVAEVAAGILFGSMALLADGWHMATHVAAFGITIFAYQYARSHANDPNYTFGTGKVSVLGGFASAVALAVIAFVMAVESVARLFQPQAIQFNEAIGVAAIGLVVNLVSALLLQDHHHTHGHEQEHHTHHAHEQHEYHAQHRHHEHHEHYEHIPHEHPHAHHEHKYSRDSHRTPAISYAESPERSEHSEQDHNLRAAYFHVLADALTSVLAIVALFAGKFLGWDWMDAVMGLVGAGVIAKWAYGLMSNTGAILLDGAIDKQLKLDIVNAIEEDVDNRITDLHVWYIGQNHISASISLVTHYPQAPEYYKNLLKNIPSLSHVVVEVYPCVGQPCMTPVAEPSHSG
jgi:cation diffusion facilitator family transporter